MAKTRRPTISRIPLAETEAQELERVTDQAEADRADWAQPAVPPSGTALSSQRQQQPALAPAAVGGSRGHEPSVPKFASDLLRDVIDDWKLETGANSSPGTLRNYEDRVELFVRYCELPIHGPKHNQPLRPDVHALKFDIVQSFVWWLQEERPGRVVGHHGQTGKPRLHPKAYSRTTVESIVKALRQLEKWLAPEPWERRTGYLQERTLKRVVFKRPAADELGRHPYTDSERDALINAASHGYTGPSWRAVLTLLFGTGVRAAELCGLNVGHVHEAEGFIELPAEITKGEVVGRNVPLYDDVRGELRQYFRERKGAVRFDAPLVTTREGRRYSPEGLKRIFRTLQSRCPTISDVTTHRTRNTFAVNFLRLGGNTVALSRILGHRDPRMAWRYAKHLPVNERAEDLAGTTPLSVRNRRTPERVPYFRRRGLTPAEKEEQIQRFETVTRPGRKSRKTTRTEIANMRAQKQKAGR